MAYCIETTWYNGYRCSCCEHTRKSSDWVESLDEALARVPTEFPHENSDWGGDIVVKIRDGNTGKYIVESDVGWPPAYQRGDGYKFTRWTLYIDEEAVPGRGCFTEQIISGKHTKQIEANRRHPISGEIEPEEPLKFITDKSWSDILSELAEARRLRDIAKAEADKADAEKRLNTLRGSP